MKKHTYTAIAAKIGSIARGASGFAIAALLSIEGALAQQTNNNGTMMTITNPLSSKFDSVGALVNGFAQIFTYVVVIFAVLALVYVGFRFVLTRGDTKEMTKLRDWLFYIVIGVAVVIGARIIISIVINTLSATGTVSPSVIQGANNALQNR